MPERDLSETIKRLTPMLSDPDLINKVDKAASKATVPSASSTMMNAEENRMMSDDQMMVKPKDPKGKQAINKAKQGSFGNNSMLAQVVGVIIGSPEFQRR
jgi:hypothetical protein